MAREINLVPDIKNEMIKTLKLRNFIFFLCIIVAAGSITMALIFGSIAGGQSIALSNRDETLKLASTKVNGYDDLNDFLTIQNQLEQLSNISDNKRVLSRTFNILSSLIPVGSDTIKISELNINLDNNTWNFDAQANAGSDNIDYRVLNAFEKSMEFMRYDYGRYVDVNGDEIPTYCIIENDVNGAIFNDNARGIYAFWTIGNEGCNMEKEDDDAHDYEYIKEDYYGQQVVRIWRTPQYDEWSTNGQMDSETGIIKNVPHFESQCIEYSGEENNGKVVWSSSNDTCVLMNLEEGDENTPGIVVSNSSNGRDGDDQLVLRFTATIYFDENVYSFANKHLISIAPSGRHNVTDSYVQLQNMFSERAHDCAPTDAACINANQEDR